MSSFAIVASVNVGPVAPAPYGAAGGLPVSAIDKRPVEGRVGAHRLGLDGDEQGDRKHHGGLDQAVYAYALEDLSAWAEQLDRPLRPGQFGENLTTLGVDVSGAVIGERWQVGTAVLEVSCPRIPCVTFENYLGIPRWIKRFTAYGAPGAYLRVVTEGLLGVGDEVALVDRPEHGVTLREVFRALTGDRSLVPRAALATALPQGAQLTLRRRLCTS